MDVGVDVGEWMWVSVENGDKFDFGKERDRERKTKMTEIKAKKGLGFFQCQTAHRLLCRPL